MPEEQKMEYYVGKSKVFFGPTSNIDETLDFKTYQASC